MLLILNNNSLILNAIKVALVSSRHMAMATAIVVPDSHKIAIMLTAIVMVGSSNLLAEKVVGRGRGLAVIGGSEAMNLKVCSNMSYTTIE
jgi:hypothetical protein